MKAWKQRLRDIENKAHELKGRAKQKYKDIKD
jgi:hypothetical protein